MKIIYWLLGHKRPYLFTPDGMRWVCARCGFASDTIKATMLYLCSKEFIWTTRDSIKPLMPFTQFKEIKGCLRSDTN